MSAGRMAGARPARQIDSRRLRSAPPSASSASLTDVEVLLYPGRNLSRMTSFLMQNRRLQHFFYTSARSSDHQLPFMWWLVIDIGAVLGHRGMLFADRESAPPLAAR